MASLTLIPTAAGGKALRLTNNALVLSATEPCCCKGCIYFWWAICNINAAVDDNMNVAINGKNLGVMNLNANAPVGWIIHTGPKPTAQQIPWDVGCYENAVFKKITKEDLVVGPNQLSTTLAQANNNGNFGTWQAGLWSINPDEDCATLGSGVYGDPPQTFTANMTQEQYDFLV